MVRYWRRGRLIVMLLLLLPFLAVFGSVHLAILILVARLRRLTPEASRKSVAGWLALWAGIGYVFCLTIGGMKITFEGAHPRELPRGSGPYIVIGNHFGVFDGILMCRLLAAAGQTDFRGVSKQEVANVPLLGHAWKILGFAFVARDHRPEDMDAVENMVRLAKADEANVLIFPEGTIYHPDKLAKGYVNVLPPKHGGFRKLTALLPDRQILCVTLRWHDFDRSAPLAGQGVLPPGSHVSMSWRVHDPPRDEDADIYLERLWRDMDATIAKAGGHGHP